MDVWTFVEKCKDVLTRKGEDDEHGCVMGYIGVKNRCYDDATMSIASATHNGRELFEVTVKYKLESGSLMKNPCIMIIDGDMIRYHGDWHYAKDHIETL